MNSGTQGTRAICPLDPPIGNNTVLLTKLKAVQHRELCPISWDKHDGREYEKNVYIHVSGSHCYTVEIGMRLN